ncbi:MAG: hypothetical protein ACRC7N_04215 [Clostridium sp.]
MKTGKSEKNATILIAVAAGVAISQMPKAVKFFKNKIRKSKEEECKVIEKELIEEINKAEEAEKEITL